MAVTPSNANTSGLKVVAWRSTWTGLTGRIVHQLHQQEAEAIRSAKWMESATFEPLVTATSAQAAIDAAEARADRLAKAGDRLVDALHRYGFPVSGGARVALTDRGSNEALELDEAASNFRAALQQEG